MKFFLATTFSLLLTLSGIGQFREQFTEANLLTEDGYYGLAIPLWRDLLRQKPNANINYKLGSCYLRLGIDRDRALPFLIKASKNVEKVYDPFSSSFKSAPIEVYYYLAKAYHINTKLDSAEKYYNKFLAEASKKQYLRPDAESGLEMCAVARELMANPLDVQIINIGSPVNSKFAEYTPIVAYDENTLYFTSRKMREDSTNTGTFDVSTGLFYEDMYVSYKSLGGKWMKPELLNINVADDHSSVVSMSPDGRRLYIYKIFNGNGNIYESEFQLGSGWTAPALVGSNINSDDNEYFATITSDEQMLYFVSDRKGGFGGKDIWYSKKLPNGEWGKAINAGEPINTEKDEDAPYLHPDGKTMYFSSNGHKSMGGYDIFYTQKTDEDLWAQPKNAGYPINTTDDDHSYIGTPSGKRAYYSSKGANSVGSTDIYVVEYNNVTDEQQPVLDMSGFALLKGWIFPAAGDKFPTELELLVTNTTTNKVIGIAKPVERNGSFVFIIPSGEEYEVTVHIGEDQLYSEKLSIQAGEKYQELSREIFLMPSGSNRKAVGLAEEVLGNVIKWRLLNKDAGKLLPIGAKIYYLNENQEKIDSSYVSKDGYFEFKTIAGATGLMLLPNTPIDHSKLEIVLLSADGEKTTKKLMEAEGVFYEAGKAPKLNSEAKVIEMVDQIVTEDDQLTASEKPSDRSKKVQADKPSSSFSNIDQNELVTNYFLPNSFMQINQIAINSAVKEVLRLVEAGREVNITLIGSASKVPTGLKGGNERLAELRLQKGKSAFEKALSDTGIEMNKISTIDTKSVVSGPEYRSHENPRSKVFADHQYFTIILN